jgi:hypothetical protein
LKRLAERRAMEERESNPIATIVINTMRDKVTTNANPRDLQGKNQLERGRFGFSEFLKARVQCMPWSYKCNMRKAGRP